MLNRRALIPLSWQRRQSPSKPARSPKYACPDLQNRCVVTYTVIKAKGEKTDR
jgi:hypothetical protein